MIPRMCKPLNLSRFEDMTGSKESSVGGGIESSQLIQRVESFQRIISKDIGDMISD